MSGRDKYAARFGDRYRPPLDWRRLRGAVKAGLPLIKRMTEAFRRYGEAMQDWREVGTMGEDGIPSTEPIVVPPGARVIGTEGGIYFSGDWGEDGIHGLSASAGTHMGGGVLDLDTPIRMRLHTVSPPAAEEPTPGYARSSYPVTWADAGTVTATIWHTDEPPDILDRIDETLTSYDATSQPEDRPWPYESF